MEWATGTTGKSIGLRDLLCDFHATALEDAETLFSTRLAEPWGLSLGFRRVRVQFGTTSLSCCFHQIRALVWPVGPRYIFSFLSRTGYGTIAGRACRIVKLVMFVNSL